MRWLAIDRRNATLARARRGAKRFRAGSRDVGAIFKFEFSHRAS
jgi:hypothetical protein